MKKKKKKKKNYLNSMENIALYLGCTLVLVEELLQFLCCWSQVVSKLSQKFVKAVSSDPMLECIMFRTCIAVIHILV